jgi:hypothetical protein
MVGGLCDLCSGMAAGDELSIANSEKGRQGTTPVPPALQHIQQVVGLLPHQSTGADATAPPASFCSQHTTKLKGSI